MAYGVDAISVGYESLGDALRSTIAARWFLAFIAAVFRMKVRIPIQACRLREVRDLRPEARSLGGDVGPGDRYSLAIKSLNNSAVRIAYMLNDGPIETFDVLLDADGKAVFDVSPQTRKGVYTFSAFSAMGSNQWIRTDKKLRVR